MKRHSRRALRCALEALESRQVLSTVSVMPSQVSLPSVTHGNGVVTVAVVGDANLDVSTIDPSTLAVTAAASGGTAQTLTLRGSPHVEGTGSSAELILKFTRSQLQQFASQLSGGTLALTIDVQGTPTSSSTSTGGTTTTTGGTTTTTTGSTTTTGGTTTGTTATDLGSATLTLFQPGHQGHGHGSHGGQGQTPGSPTGHGHHGHGSNHGSGTVSSGGTTTGSGDDSTETDGTTSVTQTSGQNLGGIPTEDNGGHGNGHGHHG